MAKTTARFGSLAVIAAALLSGCAAVKEYVKEPQVDLRDVRVTAMSLTGATLAFDLDITNPNPLGISMQGFSYRLELEDEPLFEGLHDEQLRIGAKESSRVTLPFTFGYSEVLDSLTALRGKEELRYRLSGDAKLGPFAIPYEKVGTLPMPSLPDVSLESVRVERITLSGAELALGIRVNNANGFPIRFSGLDYQLKLGDASVLQGRSSQAFAVEPNRSGTLRLPLSLDYGRMAELTQALRQGGSLPVAFTGNVKVPAGARDVTLPYQWSGDVPLFR